MNRKFLNIVASVLVMVGLLVSVLPVLARSGIRPVNGRITALDSTAQTVTITPRNGAGVTVIVDATTILRRMKNTAITFADLQLGDRVEVKYNPDTNHALLIHVNRNLSVLHGLIKSMDTTAGTLIVTKADATDVTLTVDVNTYIKRIGKHVTLADLVVGDKAEVVYNPLTMLASRIHAQPNLITAKGIVKSVDTTAGTLTVTKADATDVTFSVDANTSIKRLGKLATLADVLVGDRAVVVYNPLTMLAVRVDAQLNILKVEGTVKAVDTTANTVTITKKLHATDVVLLVDSNTVIVRHGVPAALASIQVGGKVEVRYLLLSMVATRITLK